VIEALPTKPAASNARVESEWAPTVVFDVFHEEERLPLAALALRPTLAPLAGAVIAAVGGVVSGTRREQTSKIPSASEA